MKPSSEKRRRRTDQIVGVELRAHEGGTERSIPERLIARPLRPPRPDVEVRLGAVSVAWRGAEVDSRVSEGCLDRHVEVLGPQTRQRGMRPTWQYRRRHDRAPPIRRANQSATPVATTGSRAIGVSMSPTGGVSLPTSSPSVRSTPATSASWRRLDPSMAMVLCAAASMASDSTIRTPSPTRTRRPSPKSGVANPPGEARNENRPVASTLARARCARRPDEAQAMWDQRCSLSCPMMPHQRGCRWPPPTKCRRRPRDDTDPKAGVASRRTLTSDRAGATETLPAPRQA